MNVINNYLQGLANNVLKTNTYNTTNYKSTTLDFTRYYNPLSSNVNLGTTNLNFNFPDIGSYMQKLMNSVNFNDFKIPSGLDNSSESLSNTSYKGSLNLGFGQSITNVAKSYIGYNEGDGSYKIFTNGRKEAWCADFVTYTVKQAAKESGKTLPSDFGSSSVSGLREWGIKNNCYLATSNKSNKSSIIQEKAKSGDIIIIKENGKSHTGIVDRVENGKIYTIEGNTSNDKVAKKSYSINDSSISGFIQIA
jgi:hypothetical protein